MVREDEARLGEGNNQDFQFWNGKLDLTSNVPCEMSRQTSMLIYQSPLAPDHDEDDDGGADDGGS